MLYIKHIILFFFFLLNKTIEWHTLLLKSYRWKRYEKKKVDTTLKILIFSYNITIQGGQIATHTIFVLYDNVIFIDCYLLWWVPGDLADVKPIQVYWSMWIINRNLTKNSLLLAILRIDVIWYARLNVCLVDTKYVRSRVCYYFVRPAKNQMDVRFV